jgi:hypothetical protein
MRARIKYAKEPNYQWSNDKLLMKYEQISDMKPSHFVSCKTMDFFIALKIDTSFLEKSAVLWHQDKSYIEAKEYVRKISGVNDPAERAIRFVSDFSDTKWNNEKDFQNMLCVTFRQRKET